MIITNKTNVDLEIFGCKLKPNASTKCAEAIFNTVDVHSDIGSIVITTEHSKRSFQNFGKLFAKEGGKKDRDGLKEIFIYSS